jgi:hypothetical protein
MAMRAFLVTTGIIFSLLVIVHLARIRVEPEVARDPWFWGTTLISAALSVWAWRLFWKSRRP